MESKGPFNPPKPKPWKPDTRPFNEFGELFEKWAKEKRSPQIFNSSDKRLATEFAEFALSELSNTKEKEEKKIMSDVNPDCCGRCIKGVDRCIYELPSKD